jgi:hypothetical protein
VVLQYGMPSFGDGMKPKGNSPADGGVMILELEPDEFLVAGHHVRVDFAPTFKSGKTRYWLKVEEGGATMGQENGRLLVSGTVTRLTLA